MSGTALKEKREQVEFATDVPFLRRVLTEDTAAKFTERYSEKLPRANPKAAKGDAVLSGYANTWVMDRDFEFISKRAFDNTLEAYLSKNPIILLQHNHDWPLGQMMDASTDETGLAADGYVRKPQDRDPDWKHGAYNDIIAGILRTLSIGGFFYREIVDGDILVVEIDLFEISVVAVPSNPDSIFEAAQKAAHGMEARGNVQGRAKTLDLMGQLLGLKAATAPEIVGRPELARRSLYHELAAGATREGLLVPEYHEWRNVAVQLDREGADAKAIEQEATEFIDRYGSTFGLRAVKSGISMNEARAAQGLKAIATTKAGRALSKANQAKLEEALERIQAVLAAVAEAASEEDSSSGEGKDSEMHCPKCGTYMDNAEGATCPNCGYSKSAAGATKGVFADTFTSFELSDTLYDGFWAFRCALFSLLSPDGDPYGMPDPSNMNVVDIADCCNEFRDWLVSQIKDAAAGTLSAMVTDLTVLGGLLGERKAREPELITIEVEKG